MVVGDDQIDAELARAPRGVGAADAAVDRDDQRDAVGVQPLDRRRLQPVAVLQPLGDEVHDVGAEQLERAPQDDGRRDAVHVVVAVDRDPLLARDRRQDAIDRDAHVGEQHRIVQVIERGIQEASGELRVGEPALAQQPRDDRRDRQRRRERVGGGVVAGQSVPARTDRRHSRFGNHRLHRR